MAKWTEAEDYTLIDGVCGAIAIPDIDLPAHSESSRYQRLKVLSIDTQGNSINGRIDCRRVVWTDAEIASLCSQLQSGTKPVEVKIPTKTADAIQQYLRWKRSLFRSLRAQISAGKTFAEIFIAGKTADEIRLKLYSLSLDPESLTATVVEVPERRVWSSAERASLRAQLRSGLDITAVRIAKRSSVAIEAKARQLKLIDTSTWSAAEIAELRKQIRRGVPIDEVQIKMRKDRKRRSTNAIRNKATRLGLIGDGIARVTWTVKETTFLILASKRGLPPSQLLGVLKKSIDSVAQMKRRLKKAGRI